MRQLIDLLQIAVASADAARALSGHWPDVDRPHILALGKAAVPMARAAIERYERSRGICIAPGGERLRAPGWQQFDAGHPLPTDASIAAGAAALSFAAGLRQGDRLLALISGGGSALMDLPISAPDASASLAASNGLEQWLQVQRTLLDSGLPIDVINAVRVRLSRLKGGRLLAATRATATTLAISDVPGDVLHWIASGPTVPWASGPCDALARDWLAAHFPGVPTAEPPLLEVSAEARVIASPQQSLDAAAAQARSQGLNVIVLGANLGGDALALARTHAKLALHHQNRGERLLILSGGETTVAPGARRGSGGRNQTYLLALLEALHGARGICALAADTDGIDGTGPAAGAWFDADTAGRARALGLDPAESLAQWDAGGFFAALNQTIETGPTGTNVNDFRAIAIGL